MSAGTVLRALILFALAYKFLVDPKSLSAYLFQVTGRRILLTESETSLSGLLLILLGITDAVPLIEGNPAFFRSTSKVRFFFFGLIALLSYAEVHEQLNGDLVFLYSLLEVALNFLIAMEI
jgi:hypothetical protein